MEDKSIRPEVKEQLLRKVNSSETLEQFLRTTEEEFGLPQANFEDMTSEALEKYVQMCDGLWNK